MATTEKGIYYPNDGTQPADVLGDMKKMAESIDEAINDNTYDDTEIKEDISKIKEEQEKQNKNIEKNVTNITALQEENANLKAQIPTGQAEGEEINLQDSAKMELLDFGLQGNSRQETREGYNLANYNTSADSSTLNFQIGNITTGKTYSLFLYIPVGKISFNLRYNTGAGTTILTDWNMTGKIIKTFTAEEDAILYFNGFSQSEDYEGISEIMLLEGTYTSENLPAYEEYGAMPSLNYPSEVEAVGDNINIFDDTAEKVTSTINDSGNEVADTGTNDFYKQMIIPTTDNYIMSFKSNNGNAYVRFAYYNDDTFLSREISNANNHIFTVPKNCNKIDCRINAGTNNGINFTDLKIEEGTIATAYSLPGQGSVEIVKSNANLFEETSNLEGVKTSYASIVKGNFVLQPDTYYTVTCDTNNNGGRLYLNENIFNYAGRMNCDGNRHALTTKIKNTYTSNYKNETLLKTDGAVDISYKISNVQIATNDKIDFIEHEGNAYAISIQKPFLKGDYFIKEDNQWKKVHLREKRNIKDDIENATLSSTNNFIYVSNLLLNIAQPITNEVDANVLSNVLNHATYNEMYAGSVDYGIGISQVGSLTIRINGLTTLEEYKNALNSEDYYYYFFLANPEKIECTEEQTQILEQIVKDGTYKGITHFYTTEDLKPTIEVKYYKDIETLFKNQASMQETLNNVQAQILELGGN